MQHQQAVITKHEMDTRLKFLEENWESMLTADRDTQVQLEQKVGYYQYTIQYSESPEGRSTKERAAKDLVRKFQQERREREQRQRDIQGALMEKQRAKDEQMKLEMESYDIQRREEQRSRRVEMSVRIRKKRVLIFEEQIVAPYPAISPALTSPRTIKMNKKLLPK